MGDQPGAGGHRSVPRGRAGDLDEPQLAYDEISRMGNAPRLHALWQLAHRLAGKDIPVNQQP